MAWSVCIEFWKQLCAISNLSCTSTFIPIHLTHMILYLTQLLALKDITLGHSVAANMILDCHPKPNYTRTSRIIFWMITMKLVCGWAQQTDKNDCPLMNLKGRNWPQNHCCFLLAWIKFFSEQLLVCLMIKSYSSQLHLSSIHQASALWPEIFAKLDDR